MDRPDILLIVTDQQRTDTLTCYGGADCETPHLDALAERSVVFQNAYTACPVCTPARASLMTGLYPSRHGMATNIYQPGCTIHEIADTPALLSRALAGAGYACGYTGKWHLGEGPLPTGADTAPWPAHYRQAGGSLPTLVGFEGDDFPGHGGGGYDYPQFADYLRDRGLRFELADVVEEFSHNGRWHTSWGEVTSPIESTVEYFLVERAIHLIDDLRHRGQPWCFQLHFWGPHEPFYAPTEYLDRYRNRALEPWASFDERPVNKPSIHEMWRRRDKDWGFFEQALRHCYGFMSSIDAQIGRLLAWMEGEGILDNTLVIFTADHGDSQGCHGGIENKAIHMYEEIVRVPLLVKPPRATTAGRDTRRDEQRFAGTCDLYSTILDAAGVARADAERDGRSLLPLLAGDAPADWPEEAVVEGAGIVDVLHTQRMIRRGDLKYVFNAGDVDELYDLAADPAELTNRIDDPGCAAALKEMREALSAWMRAHEDGLLWNFRHMRRLDE